MKTNIQDASKTCLTVLRASVVLQSENFNSCSCVSRGAVTPRLITSDDTRKWKGEKSSPKCIILSQVSPLEEDWELGRDFNQKQNFGGKSP